MISKLYKFLKRNLFFKRFCLSLKEENFIILFHFDPLHPSPLNKQIMAILESLCTILNPTFSGGNNMKTDYLNSRTTHQINGINQSQRVRVRKAIKSIIN